MKKTAKKAAFASEACLLAMVTFGCVYGPPPDEDVMTPPATTAQESEIPTEKETSDTTEKSTENAAAESEGASENSETAAPTFPTTYEPTEPPIPVYGPPKIFGIF